MFNPNACPKCQAPETPQAPCQACYPAYARYKRAQAAENAWRATAQPAPDLAARRTGARTVALRLAPGGVWAYSRPRPRLAPLALALVALCLAWLAL